MCMTRRTFAYAVITLKVLDKEINGQTTPQVST